VPAGRTPWVTDVLFDGDLADRAPPGIGDDPDIFEAHEMRDDLVRARLEFE
jgi:hypothetical protein